MEDASIRGFFSCSGRCSVFGRVSFLPYPCSSPMAPGPHLSRPAWFWVGSVQVPALVPDDTVARDPCYASTRHWIWAPCPGDPPSPCPWLCKGGSYKLRFLGASEPHHWDGCQCLEYSIYHLLFAQWGEMVYYGPNGGVTPLRRNATVPCRS